MRLAFRPSSTALCGMGLFLVFAGALGCGEARASDDENAAEEQAPELVPGCEAQSTAVCDVTAEDCQERIYRLMRCVRGMEPDQGKPPPVDFLTGEEFDALFDEEPEEMSAPAADEALQLLGLLEADATYDDVSSAKAKEFYGALYFDETKRVAFKRGDEPGAWESVVLAHEFVHALQDETLDLATYRKDYVTSTESALAVRSLIEGEAKALEMKVAPYMLGIEPTDAAYEAYVNGAVEDGNSALLDESPFVGALMPFPYTFGLRSAWATYQKGGNEALAKRYDAVPSTLEIWQAAPVSGVLTTEFPEVVAPPDYAAIADDVLGAWTLRAIVQNLAPKTAADGLAAGWRGDRFQVFASTLDESLAAVAYAIEWSDESQAILATNAFLGLAPAWQLEVVRDQTRTTLYLTSAEGVLADWAR